MRVIAGQYKGRKLAAPSGNDIRPTTDKTKEAMFSIIAFELPESNVLDIFSGTGSLGIEALSRGARSCTFCEKSRQAVQQIRENLDHCGIGSEAVVRSGDALRILESMGERSERFHIILMDPPYEQGLCEKALRIISDGRILEDDGTIICEHRREDIMPENVGDLILRKQRRYGISMLSIYGREEGEINAHNEGL